MTPILRTPALRLAGAMLLAAGTATVVTAPAPALAQDSTADARIRKIEAEVRALQRKVFPGGDGRFFEPQIGPGGDPAAPTTTSSTAAPSSTAVTDILVRLDTLETQLRGLTARSEEQANALSQMELRLAALETAANMPITTTPPSAATLPAFQPAPTSAPSTTLPAVRPPVQTAPTPAPAASVAAPSASRLAAVQAITKPQTEDAGDDEYSYGFRLWSAGFFPEARQQLTKFVEQYPSHPRISFGRNLLGRAFLDDNLPDEAARWFLRNYQANKAGDRAPDSLLYLGKAMIAKNDTRKACIALAEFGETYPLVATGRLADEYRNSLAKVKCS
ncbi:TolA-binding protein [Erythromicrobium ramosum]|uniref:Tetratricopeptide repeat protein n=1 Tax=Erythrobacter ramosus TaxID=35811 RepID=A0A6I4UGS3_9SPHN|nr:tetratricopeptide repeat protein [Erythrobacter ramosus]MBB3775324.1 TolA-binding protein [Erythrobacter ramosus]MXP37054.1 tetratricopeptide repeat protein [Erythrobacter ramosus]